MLFCSKAIVLSDNSADVNSRGNAESCIFFPAFPKVFTAVIQVTLATATLASAVKQHRVWVSSIALSPFSHMLKMLALKLSRKG